MAAHSSAKVGAAGPWGRQELDTAALGTKPSCRWGTRAARASRHRTGFSSSVVLPGPCRGDSRAQQWAAAVGNPALVVPEGGARPLRTAPGVGLRVVTQHELATPPRCAHWAQVLGRLVDPSQRTPPHSSAVLCPQGGLTERGPLWWAALGGSQRLDCLLVLAPRVRPGPGGLQATPAARALTLLLPQEAPWTCSQGSGHTAASLPEASPDPGWGRWPAGLKAARGAVGKGPAWNQPKCPNRGGPIHPALPGPGFPACRGAEAQR